ncbi:zinc transporter ZIP12-like [Lytechinus pictus]|uniref:zinc transporter ZIP12-like n=1 Tax=Lytechinus pictus TaxID=7653 RepID=UPI0030B9DF95
MPELKNLSCIPAETLFRIVGVDTRDGYLSEATFGPASLVILYYIHAPEATCTLGPSTVGTNDSFSYRDYLLALSGLNSTDSTPKLGSRISFGNGAMFSEEKLQLLLKSINKTYIPTSSFQCFQAHTLIKAASIPDEHDIAQSGLEILAAHLVSSLLHGHCIGEGLLVPPSYFSDYIFDEFGSNHIIREAGLQRLLGTLDLGFVLTDQSAEGGDHGHDHGHDHRDHDHANSGPTFGRGSATGQGQGTGHDHGHRPGGHGPTNKTTSVTPTLDPHAGHGVHGHHDHHGHGHGPPHHFGFLMERNVINDHRTKRRATHLHSPGHEHQAENDTFQQCYSGDQLLDIFGINEALGISERQFSELCPAILHQIITDACNPDMRTDVRPVGPLSTAEVYGYGTLAVFIITATSILAVLILPCLSDSVQQYVIHAFVALSISTMSGDALMHLIPQAIGLHSHGDDDENDHHAPDGNHDHGVMLVEIDMMNIMYKMATVLGAIYFFFLFESLMNVLFSRKKSEDAETRRCSRLVEDCDEKTSVFNQQTEQVWLNDTDNGIPNLPEPSTLTPLSINMNGNNDAEDRGFESLVQEQKDEDNRSFFMRGLTPVSIMVLLGDALHNAMDGLVLGAAFTSNIFVGISTSIAILCHEIPHELGDFGVLIENGMSNRRAVFWNFASGCSAFAGLYLGIIIGTREGAQQWLFAITAGFFLYISMVDLFGGMLRKDDHGHGHSHGSSSTSLKRSPAMSNRHSWLQEMALNEKSEKRSKLAVFICQNIGLLVGWAIMFLLSYYEEELLHLNIFNR